jgi:hypothetical protein
MTNLKVIAMNAPIMTAAELISRAEAHEAEARELRAEAAHPDVPFSDIADLKAAAAELDGAAIHMRRMANRGHRA